MTQSTRQEILDAHEELEKLCNRLPGTRRAKMTILTALPPKPKPTMAEVEWDDDKHYLAEAESHKLGKVVMLRKTGGLIEFTMKPYTPQTKGAIWPEQLTPTGKHYTLTEVQDD
nr:MAG TPA: hypothetical protein [Caudoviricetes sp.]